MRLRTTKPKSKARLGLAAGFLFIGATFIGVVESAAQPAPGVSPRIALVIGEARYKTGPLASAANDAGLIADTLQRAGFDVTGAADLDQDGLRKALREFVDKAAAAGPDAVAVVYISGRGLQYAGDNYIAPIEANIPRAVDVPLEAVRLSDYLQPLSQMPMKAKVVVLDAAKINAFAQTGDPLAGGLALVDPPPGALYAFNAAPGSVAPNEPGPYGVYAQSLAEALRQPGMPLDQAFDQTRLRVSETTKGAIIPWDESKLTSPFALFAAAPGAPRPVAEATVTRLRARPIRDYSVDDAYIAAIDRDTIDGYLDFLAAYPDSPYAPRVRAILAVRREALTWRRAIGDDTPRAYWTYLRLYPYGPHADDARRRLAFLHAALAAPETFEDVNFDVPPPPPDDVDYFRRPYVVFENPDWAPPPPPPVGYLPPPVMIVNEPPPPPPHGGLLPLPLVVAPLIGAAVASHMGVFHAPAVIQAQSPGAQDYYNRFNRPQPGGAPPVAPGTGPAPTPMAPAGGGFPHPGAPTSAAPAMTPAAPMAPAAPHPAAPGGVIPPAPGGAPLPHPGAPAGAAPTAPAMTPAAPHPAAPGGAIPTGPSGAPLPHPGASPPAVGAHPGAGPAMAPAAPLPHVNAPQIAPQTAPPVAHPEAPAAPQVAPHMIEPPASHVPPPAMPHVAPRMTEPPHPAAPPAPPHMAPPPAPHVPPPPAAAPHMMEPPAPHVPPPAMPHVAPPPPHMAPPAAPPHMEPPHPGGPPPHERPRCGGPGEPPCR